jgi:hypothetical protein
MNMHGPFKAGNSKRQTALKRESDSWRYYFCTIIISCCGAQKSWAPKFCQVAPKNCGFLVQNLLHPFPLGSRILRWLLLFKLRELLVYLKLEHTIFKNIGHENASEN